MPVDRALWDLDPGVIHLNHASYGAVPRPVAEARDAAMRRVEASPERFYRATIHDDLAAVREEVATFLGVAPDATALVANVTEAVEVVLRAVDLRPGDRIVLNDHAYPWVIRAARERAAAVGAEVGLVSLPDPSRPDFDDAVVAAHLDAVDGGTRLVVVDQITSATALRLPAERIATALADGPPVLIDGAHAPGLLVEPARTAATFWTGNLHKWAFAPRTAAALVCTDEEWQARLRPTVVSADVDRPFPSRFDYQGTRDVSALLALPAALAFPSDHLGVTFEQLRGRNADVLGRALDLLGPMLGVAPPTVTFLPMHTLHLPNAATPAQADAMTAALTADGVEALFFSVAGRLAWRLSVQAYLDVDDIVAAAQRVAVALAG